MYSSVKSTSLQAVLKRIPVIILLVVVSFVFMNSIQAQHEVTSTPRVSVEANNVPLLQVLAIIEQQIPYRFAYNTELVAKHKHVNIDVENKPLDELFRDVLKGTNITYSIIDNQIVLNEMPESYQITLSGYVKDSITGETLPGAIIYLPHKETGTYTNNYGFFSLTQNREDSVELQVSYMGFHKITKKVNASQDATVNLYLTINNLELNSVIITDKQADDNLKKQYPGKTDISMDRVKSMPSINGNGDIVNSIQMLPGVMAGLDGRPGYFIRGGNTDQNLVQLDEATLYNPNHLLGLVSVFNSSAIKSAYLLKAGFPASFGDHLSSVLDVTMKDGNDQHFGGDLQLGTISSGFTYSGPIVSDKASFFVAARRSTIDMLLKPLDVTDYYSNYNFYDINAKLNLKLSPRDRLFVSYYEGRDNSSYSTDTTSQNEIGYRVKYGNRAFTLRWNHLFSQKLFSNTSITYNNYFHEVKASQQQFYAELYSGIKDVELKSDISYYPNANHKMSAGINYLYQTLFPASVSDISAIPETNTAIDPDEIHKKYSNRVAAYFSDEITLSRKLSAYVGARIPFFHNKEARYLKFEPRLSLMYLAGSTSSIKISYTHMHQYLHLVQSYNASFPAQIWIGSSDLVKPQNSQETSLGFFKNFANNMFQTSFEIYYKKMGNQLLFRGGQEPAFGSDIENTLIFGKGQSYGAELFVGKNTGNFTGWLAYTLSYSKQKFDSLNLGQQFPFAGDRRHSLYLSLSYALNKNWQVSSNFLLASGSAFTIFNYISPNKWTNDNPLYYYSGNGNADNGGNGNVDANIPSSRIVQNNHRLAPYNRLDLSVSYHKSTTFINRKMETEWVFSVYNVYARANTFFAYCSLDPVTKKPIAVEVSFIPVIPSVSFNVKF